MESKIKADLMSGEGLLHGSQMAVFSLGPHMMTLMRALIPYDLINCQGPHLLVLLYGGLGYQHMFFCFVLF